MIRITFEYPNVETAIVALGKLISAAPPLVQGGTTDPSVPGAAEPTKRKRRADKGKARGSYKEHAEAITKTPEPAAPAPQASPQVAPATEAPAAADRKPAATVASPEDVQVALEKLFSTKGAQAAVSVLAVFGASRARDLKPEDRAAFIAKAEKAVTE